MPSGQPSARGDTGFRANRTVLALALPEPPEFAPRYSLHERLRLALIAAVLFVLLYALLKLWLLPALDAIAANVTSAQDARGLLLGVLAGVPLALSLLVCATVGRKGWRTLRGGQYPPAGEKTLGRIRVRRGRAASLIGWLMTLAALPLLALALWGVLLTQRLTGV